MYDLIKINNQDLTVKEFNGQRVVTFKDIDTLHERAEGTAKRNFNENRIDSNGEARFIEGIDFFFITSGQKNEIRTFEIPNRGITLITESGYLMLVKSLQDNLAWKVQRELVNNYFRVKDQRPTCIEDVLIQSLQQMKEVKYQLQETKQEVQAIREVVEIRPSQSWRGETNSFVKKICYKLNDYKTPKDNIYKALQERAGCDLKIRLKNMRGRLALEGATKTKIDNLNYLDVIEEDKKLIEIYTAIVKEMAIKYKVA